MNANTYITETSSGMEIYVSGTRAVTFEQSGGTLHGVWDADNALSLSDRRLKKDIVPLQRTLRDALSNALSDAASDKDKVDGAMDAGLQQLSGAKAALKPGASAADSTLWLLRQLRPVSYHFKKGAESKYMRFGFIADELESVVPQVVRSVGNRDYEDQKAVVYQDLIALLVAASQSQTQKLDEQSAKIVELENAQAEQSRQMAELLAELQKIKQEDGAFRRAGVSNATSELANETDQNATNTTDENATVSANLSNITDAAMNNKTMQTRLRRS